MKFANILPGLAGLAVVSATCPDSGATNAAGDYGCNPAHSYPNQACALIGGCYVLRGLGLMTPTTTATAQPTQSCPSPGSTNTAGDYGCNPAHSYPNQACALVGGCYVLRGLGVSPTSSAPQPQSTNGTTSWATAMPTHVVVAGAARLPAAGVMAVAVFGTLLL